MALKNGENSIVVQIDFKCHINVKLALDDGDSSLHVSQCSYSYSSSSCCCLHTLLIIMATMRLHTRTQTHTHGRGDIAYRLATRTHTRSKSEGQSLDFWPWLDRWFVSVQASHEFRWTPINNHIRPMLPASFPLSTHPVPVPATNMKNDRWQREFFAFSLALSLQVVAGRAPPASAVGVYLKLFFFLPPSPSTHPFPLHYDAALLPPLWFTWLCPVSTFWHKSQLTRPRPSLGTLNDPSLLEITPPPPPGKLRALHYATHNWGNQARARAASCTCLYSNGQRAQ